MKEVTPISIISENGTKEINKRKATNYLILNW